MTSIGVIGQGFVGGSLTTVFSRKHQTTVYAYDKTGKLAQGATEIFMPDVVRKPASVYEFAKACVLLNKNEYDEKFSNVFFVCVPTPMYADGSADISIVENVLDDISDVSFETKNDVIAVIKSTVPPGSTHKWNEKYKDKFLHVIFNPEFLTEANALQDMENQDRIILGGPRPWINEVKSIFENAFIGVPVIKTGSTTAEMVKYTTNCFLAVKVSFANELAQICEALDDEGLNIDYDKVVEYAKLDKRLGNSHWSVPGPMATHDGRYVKGWGGSCFVKDLNALMFEATSLGVDTKVMRAAWEKNLEVRKPEDRDWEHLQGRAVSVNVKS